MAKYNVKFSCGHCEEKQLFGKETERSRYIAWAGKEGICTVCGKANRDAESSEMIAAIEAEHDLPGLDGSEKQVAWARKIRAEKIATISKIIAKYSDKAALQGEQEKFDSHVALVMQGLYSKTASKWWIDNREKTAQTLMQAMFVEASK